jgi:hypothetical protein
VRRLNSADAPRMCSIVAMPPPEWRGENIPRFAHFARALADPAVCMFAAFEGERPAGFVSAYRFPSLTEECISSTFMTSTWRLPTRQAASGAGSWSASLPSAGGTARQRPGSARIWTTKRRSFMSAGATGRGQEYVQFEFDLAAAGGEEKA